MPATERSFTDPPPERLYLDTDVLIAYLVRTQPHHARCRVFLERVALHGTTIYLSSLSWIEFAHVITRERFRRDLPAAVRRRLRLSRWEEGMVRQAYLQEFQGAFLNGPA